MNTPLHGMGNYSDLFFFLKKKTKVYNVHTSTVVPRLDIYEGVLIRP